MPIKMDQIKLSGFLKSVSDFLSDDDPGGLGGPGITRAELDAKDLIKGSAERISVSTLVAYNPDNGGTTFLGPDSPDSREGLKVEDHKWVDSYAILIESFGKNGFSREFKLVGSEDEANTMALDLAESNRNNVESVGVLRGLALTFSGRPVFRGTHLFFSLSKAEECVPQETSLTKEERKSLTKSHTHYVEIKKAVLDQGLVYGVVYEPFIKDTDGDWAAPADIQAAAHNFLPNAKLNLFHNDLQDLEKSEAQVVESYIAPVSFNLDGDVIAKGSWVLVTRVLDEGVKQAIADGDINGYSLEGSAVRV